MTVTVLVAMASAVLALVALAAPSASAHTATIESQHSLSLGRGIISGQLTAPVSDCLSGRQVTLYRVDTVGATAVSSTSTDGTGAWTRSTSDLQGGDYYAIAASGFVRQPGHKHTCASATSNTVTVPTVAQDADGDGYTTALGDCDDTSPAVNPGATEVANGVDDDCDGSIDEGYQTAPTTCWVPSSEPATATTTWAQVPGSQPCTWELQTFTVLPGAVYMVSYDWMIEYRPAAGEPVAFEYDGQGWAYYATHQNCCYSGA